MCCLKPRRGRVECSTPFGITEVGTIVMRFTHLMYPLKCSTPFGITEVGTRQIRQPLTDWEKCSTPFGITEVGTRSTIAGIAVFAGVLNAFRHH